ncbi:hypothetical protein UA32_03840 [Photobacterium angustum]|uniref:Uncharacterized protein n=1 Tax=Photobacterium angustum TaxID=661 RepID=A0ABX5H474_PHOAN|nr:hypothetical protein UA32_03840 [Photobacterium angustum]PSX10554.1 hypothetical protein C0W27_11045 [Photobacterium angustum]
MKYQREFYLILSAFYFFESKYLPLDAHQFFFMKFGSDFTLMFSIFITLTFVNRSNNINNKTFLVLNNNIANHFFHKQLTFTSLNYLFKFTIAHILIKAFYL